MLSRTLPELIRRQADARGDRHALSFRREQLTFTELYDACNAFANALLTLGVAPGERVAIYLGKSTKMVQAMLGASLAQLIFVPINPILKATQVGHILRDSGAKVLVTDNARLATVTGQLGSCTEIAAIIVTDETVIPELAESHKAELHPWSFVTEQSANTIAGIVQETDLAAILYTSGSTGNPKGVALSHANLAIGALSVADYIGNNHEDRILAVLPLSFDAGLSQVTTAIASGAQVVLLDYLLPQDVVKAVQRHAITGLTCVPPLWHQLASLKWPAESGHSLKYFANTGGKMTAPLLSKLRQLFPRAKPFLMYGLTEAFRSTYLPPDMVDTKPGSIGKAIPNAVISVVDEDGLLCAPNEPGELVHSGPLVAQGYWNDPRRTAQRFRATPGYPSGSPNPPLSVWSGDQVMADEEGYLYFIGRKDDMIKSSGYRISPTEIEDFVTGHPMVAEVAAFGIDDEVLGQSIAVIVGKTEEHDSQADDTELLLADLKTKMPAYMLPKHVIWLDALPRNQNGKIDRTQLRNEYMSRNE